MPPTVSSVTPLKPGNTQQCTAPSLLSSTDHIHITKVGTHGIIFENSDRLRCFVQGFEVVIASTKGGKIPIDEVSLQEANFTEVAKAFHSNSMLPAPLHMRITLPSWHAQAMHHTPSTCQTVPVLL